MELGVGSGCVVPHLNFMEFSPVPPSSYLRMSPECTPRMSPSMFLRWTTPRRSAEMKKRMLNRYRLNFNWNNKFNKKAEL